MGLLSTLHIFRKNKPEAPATSPVAAESLAAEAPAVPPVPAPVAPPAAAPATPAPDPAARARAEALVRQVVAELPDFMAVAVLEAATGRILAGQWAGHSGGALEAAAAHAELVRQVGLLCAALQLDPSEQLEEVMLTLRQQLHLLRPLPASPWLLYLAVRSQGTNPALVRTVLREVALA